MWYKPQTQPSHNVQSKSWIIRLVDQTSGNKEFNAVNDNKWHHFHRKNYTSEEDARLLNYWIFFTFIKHQFIVSQNQTENILTRTKPTLSKLFSFFFICANFSANQPVNHCFLHTQSVLFLKSSWYTVIQKAIATSPS